MCQQLQLAEAGEGWFILVASIKQKQKASEGPCNCQHCRLIRHYRLHDVTFSCFPSTFDMGKKGDSVADKRQIPGFLQNLLQLDVLLTDKFCKIVEKIVPKSWQSYYKALEISCHGIPWLVGWLAFIWIWNSSSLYQMQVNFFIGLLLDIVIVAVVKAITRRRRPKANRGDMFATVSVDKFSFPSGHATRACFITHFFTQVFIMSPIIGLTLILWSVSVCVSRVLLHRHHLLDVAAGVCIGIFESKFLSYLWLSNEWCMWLLSMITDEKLDGGEYHV